MEMKSENEEAEAGWKNNTERDQFHPPRLVLVVQVERAMFIVGLVIVTLHDCRVLLIRCVGRHLAMIKIRRSPGMPGICLPDQGLAHLQPSLSHALQSHIPINNSFVLAASSRP